MHDRFDWQRWFANASLAIAPLPAIVGLIWLALWPANWLPASWIKACGSTQCIAIAIIAALGVGAGASAYLWKNRTVQSSHARYARIVVFVVGVPVLGGILASAALLGYDKPGSSALQSRQHKLIIVAERSAITDFPISQADSRSNSSENSKLENNGLLQLQYNICRAVASTSQQHTVGTVPDFVTLLQRLVDWQPLTMPNESQDENAARELWLFDGEYVEPLSLNRDESPAEVFKRVINTGIVATTPRGPNRQTLVDYIKNKTAETDTVLLLTTGDRFKLSDGAIWRNELEQAATRIVIVQLPSLPRAGSMRFSTDKFHLLGGERVHHFWAETRNAGSTGQLLNLYETPMDSEHPLFDDTLAGFWDRPRDLDKLRRDYFSVDRFKAFDSPQFKQAMDLLQKELNGGVSQTANFYEPNYAALILALGYGTVLLLLSSSLITKYTVARTSIPLINRVTYWCVIGVGILGLCSVVGTLWLFHCNGFDTRAYCGRPALCVWIYCATWLAFCLAPILTAADVADHPESDAQRSKAKRGRNYTIVFVLTLAIPLVVAVVCRNWLGNLIAWIVTIVAVALLMIKARSGQSSSKQDKAQEQNLWSTPCRWCFVATAIAFAAAFLVAGVCALPGDVEQFNFAVLTTLSVVMLWTFGVWKLAK